MRVVLDTNTLVSAIGWDGPPRQILIALREGEHTLITSPALLDELTRVLTYPKLHPVATHPLLSTILAWLHQPEHLVIPQERISVVRADPADNSVLEVAIAGKADTIISGDRDLLTLHRFRGIPILTARGFVARHLRQGTGG